MLYSDAGMGYARRHMLALHHALLYVGSHEECLARIPESDRSGVDAEVIIREQLDIDEVRALSERAASRPILGAKRRFIISCGQFSNEAQNALLKLFEDPPLTAQFYVIVPRVSVLLPTLRSRLHLVYEADVSRDALDEEAMSFLHASFAERLLHIAKLAKEKDTAGMRALIRGIERAVAEHLREKNNAAYVPDVLLASSYSETRGASHKMLLEHLALSIPQKLS
jgi:DNA polymerase III delta prime subunit